MDEVQKGIELCESRVMLESAKEPVGLEPLKERTGDSYEITRLGEQALLIRFGRRIEADTYERVLQLDRSLREHPFPGLIETVLTYAAVAVYYDPWFIYRHTDRDQAPYEFVSAYVRKLIDGLSDSGESIQASSLRIIPVCYGGEYGPDLAAVAAHHRLSETEVIELHIAPEYQVYMIGFLPGFPYMGGLSERLATPRLNTPRLSVPAGSVGIAGTQTGIYPLGSPGGWQLIGRTPLSLFQPNAELPSFLQAGDRVKFMAIGPEEYEQMRAEQEKLHQ